MITFLLIWIHVTSFKIWLKVDLESNYSSQSKFFFFLNGGG